MKKQVLENVVFNYAEVYDWVLNNEKAELKSVQFSFTFYDKTYFVNVYLEDIENDTPIVYLEGDSTLFDSFEGLCENELWTFIKEKSMQLKEEFLSE